MSARLVALAAGALVFCALEGTAAARGCSEVSDVVGYERCHRYGDGWAVERRLPLGLALELPYARFDPNGIDFGFDKGKGSPTFEIPGRTLGADVLATAGFVVRVEGFVWKWLYLGVEFGLGLGHNEITPFTATVGDTSSTFVASGSVVNTTLIHAGLFAGVRVPLGRFSVRLEAFAGGNLVNLDVDAGKDGYTGLGARGDVGPRAVLDFWASPNFTIGAYGAFDALDTNEQTMGLVLELHVRSFDGAFSF